MKTAITILVLMSVTLFFSGSIVFAAAGGKSFRCPAKPKAVLAGTVSGIDFVGYTRHQGTLEFNLTNGSLENVYGYVKNGCSISFVFALTGDKVAAKDVCGSVVASDLDIICQLEHNVRSTVAPFTPDNNSVRITDPSYYLSVASQGSGGLKFFAGGYVDDEWKRYTAVPFGYSRTSIEATVSVFVES